jgi:site-specific recombinase XerD
VTHLRQMMLDELQRRNYSPNTVRSYVHAVEEFARYFRRSPGQLGPDHVPSFTACSITPQSARKETHRRRRSCANPCSLATRDNVFPDAQPTAS